MREGEGGCDCACLAWVDGDGGGGEGYSGEFFVAKSHVSVYGLVTAAVEGVECRCGLVGDHVRDWFLANVLYGESV